MRYILIGVLYIVAMLFGCPMWLSNPAVPSILRALSYQAFHANLFHLAVNCLSIWMVFRSGRSKEVKELILGLLIGVLVFPLSPRPIVGISNMLFAVVGMRTPSFRSGWWKSTNAVVFMVVNIALVVIPQISAITHIVSFAVGVLIAMASRFIKRIDNDIHGATGR